MYLYHKRSKHRQKLAQKGKICPSCKSTNLKLTEPGRDRTTFTCQDCGAISTFTKLPDTAIHKSVTVKNLSAITIRDRSSEYPTKHNIQSLKNESIYSVLEIVRKAMKDTVILSFDYVSSDGTKSSRNIEPYKLTNKNGSIVLFGYDLENGGIRTFKVKNMAYVEQQEYAYKQRYAIEDKLKDKDVKK